MRGGAAPAWRNQERPTLSKGIPVEARRSKNLRSRTTTAWLPDPSRKSVTGAEQYGKAAPADDYKWGRNRTQGDAMPTTILCGETIDQARARRFAEEAATDMRLMASAQRAFTVTVKTSAGVETLNVLAFTSCDAIVRAIDILFDGEQPMPCDGMSISAFPFLPKAA